MYKSLIKSLQLAGIFVAIGSIVGIGDIAQAAAPDEIPTQLLNKPGIDDLNGPCSLCQVHSIKAAEEIVGEQTKLEIYFDDERGEMSGSLELTVLLHNGEFYVVTIENVTLSPHEITVFELEPVVGFDWNDDVQHLWVEPIPAGSGG